MKISFGFILSNLYVLFVETMHFNDYNRDIVNFIIDVQKQYYRISQGNSVIIATDAKHMGFSYESEVSLKLCYDFSDRRVSSMFTTFKNLYKIIEYRKNKNDRPLYVIFLENYDDFVYFIDISNNTSRILLSMLLIFKSNNDTLMEICKNPKRNYFNLAFDSFVLVVCLEQDIPVREWYSIHYDKTEIIDYATWTADRGIQLLDSKYMYERRNSLKGKKLRIAYVKNEIEENNGTLQGYFGEFIKTISELTNFTIELQNPEDAYGLYDKVTKKWNGVIKLLANDETDIGLGEFTMTTKRLDVADFSLPIILSSTYFFIKKSDEILPQSIYYNAFGPRAACLLFFIYLLAPILTTFILYKHDKTDYYNKNVWNIARTLKDNYMLVWGILCKMPLPNIASISSLRMTYLSLFIFSLMLSAVYSAILTSYLSNLIFELPFNSIEGFIKDGTYKLTSIKDTSLLERFQDSNDKFINKLQYFLLDKKYLPDSVYTAVKQFCESRKMALYIDDYSISVQRAESSCNYVAFASGYFDSVSIAFAKHSPYVELFNFCIQKLRSSGILHVLKKRSLQLYTPKIYNYHQLTVGNAKFIFVILMGGLCSSVVIFILEKIFFHFFPTPLHDFTASRKNYWTPLIRPRKRTNNKQPCNNLKPH